MLVACGGHLKSIVGIEDPLLIEKFLTHLDGNHADNTGRRNRNEAQG